MRGLKKMQKKNFAVAFCLKSTLVDFKKKYSKNIFCFFFQSSHHVVMKNMVECLREFFAYFNALEARSERVIDILQE